MQDELKKDIYRKYMSDVAMHAVNNLAQVAGGVSITKSYSDIIEIPIESKRTASEIIDSIASRLNGVKNDQLI